MTDAPDFRDTVFLPKTEFPMKAGLAQKEPAILERWARINLYHKLREQRAGRPRFILHDGPPYANGDIHMGHAMNKILKDIVVRSQSLMGKDAPYIPGWDCHGLPIEWQIEKQYKDKKRNKDEVPAAEFRAECRAYAAKWVDVQREQFKRLGVMGDWEDPYLTMDFDAEATIAGELLKFAESGQLYRGAKPVMWSPVEKTALAEAEVEYEDIVSTQIDVAFEIVEAPNAPELVGAHAVIWTTTPWTIPVNQALAYGPEVNYRLIEITPLLGSLGLKGTKFVIASDLVETFRSRLEKPLRTLAEASNWGSDPIVEIDYLEIAERDGVDFPPYEFKGSDLAGAVARHPMHHLGGFFAKPRPFLPGDFVTTDAGTGLVHMSPDHGEDDFLLCKAHGIDPVFAVDDAGFYRADWGWLPGQGSVINKKLNAPDGPICSDLRATGGLLAASDDFQHSYPHSWRSKAKIIFRCTPQWFIPMDKPISSSPSPLQGRGPGRGGLSTSDSFEDTAPLPTSLRSATSSGSTSPRDVEVVPGAQPTPNSPEGERGFGNGPTLRELAADAIQRTRWVPEKGQNRIAAMVEGRPDWVISRQRAWGVPIPIYVHRKSGEYLRDTAVNARILDAFRSGGADAWFAADHQALLGPDYALADYEVVNDILDVWFDSGSTHVFTIEKRFGEGVRADLYLEGSDQHRGWFQSSLLESCGTRGRAPYDAVLTHGFALDGQGKKMSKSDGNVVDPLKIIGESGADILRLWVAQTDYFEDVRIGKEVLAGTGDTYRKLRNSFRYLLGALEGFTDAEKLPVAEMPELERYILHKLAALDAELKAAAEAFEFNRYTRALTDFANEDLSAFFFDIRKDCLYCEAPDAPKRRAYRTALDILFHALVRYAAPIIAFTAEEVWQSRYPSEDGSVHFLEWPEIVAEWYNEGLGLKWERLRGYRRLVTEAIEPLRRDKAIRSSLEAEIDFSFSTCHDIETTPAALLAEYFIVSDVRWGSPGGADYAPAGSPPQWEVHHPEGATVSLDRKIGVTVTPTQRLKCGRCWRHLPEVAQDGALCDRCDGVVNR